MPDPISPAGSPGQLPPKAQTQGASVSVPGLAPESPRASAAEVPFVEQSSEAVSLEIAQKKIKEKVNEEDLQTPSLEDASKTLKEYFKNLPSDLQFRKDVETGTVTFKVVNPVTQEVIREFPPEEVVEMSKRLRKLAQQNQKSGLLLDNNY